MKKTLTYLAILAAVILAIYVISKQGKRPPLSPRSIPVTKGTPRYNMYRPQAASVSSAGTAIAPDLSA